MRRQVLLAILPLVPLLPLTACLDGTEPFPRPANAVDVNVDFCFTDMPSWFAVKNEGQGWHVISRTTRQRHVIAVTPKVVIAYGRTFIGSVVFSQAKVMYVTADELASATCGALIGSKTLYANVVGNETSTNVFASIGAGSGRTDPCPNGQCNFGTPTQVRITGVVDGTVDMLAYRFSQSSARTEYVLRHAINAPHLALIDPIDFGSAEAGFAIRLPLEVSGGLNAIVSSRFLSGAGTALDLGFTNVAGGFGDYFALLPGMLQPADLHRVSVLTPEGTGVTTYAAPGQALQVTTGPALPPPAVSIVQEDSVLRMRAAWTAQAEYPRYATATFSQADENGITNRTVSVVVTRAWLGADPAQWELEIPPMPFFNPVAQLQPGAATDWYVEAWSDVPPSLFFGDKGATAGAVVRCATAFSTQAVPLNGCRSPLQLR